MTIRKRLASFIILMIGFLVIMGSLLEFGGPIIVGAFRQSLDAMNSLNAIRELDYNIDREKTSLNRYLLLDDPKELLTFEESIQSARKILRTMEGEFKGDTPKWFDGLKSQIEKVHNESNDVVGHFKSGKKSHARELWISRLYPELQSLSKTVNDLETRETKKAESMFIMIKELSGKVGIVVSIVFAIAILAGIFLFRSLYRAVMKPLEILKRSAEKFGQGHFDHRINLPSKNEFGALADSFNTMASNVSQLQSQAVHMDRMSAVGQLAGGVAHEINNPLTAVLGQTQIMLSKLDGKDPKHASLKKIENAAIRCRKIVRGLLDFSRPTQSRFEKIDANSMILSTLDLCEADLKKGRVVVDKQLGAQLPRLRGNVSELQQVLLNLINNALQAMPHGGTLTILTRSHHDPIRIADPAKRSSARVVEGQWVEIRVKDTGIGISKDHLDRIFDPFFTTKDIGKGTGLGLSVSTGIIRKHGGILSAESKGINRGSTFIMTLSVKGPQAGSKNQKNQGMAA